MHRFPYSSSPYVCKRDRGDGGGDSTRPLPRRNSRDASASRSRSRDRRGARDDPPSV